MSLTFLITKLEASMCLTQEVFNLSFGLIQWSIYDYLVPVELFVVGFVHWSLFHRKNATLKTLCSSNMMSIIFIFAIAWLFKILTNWLPWLLMNPLACFPLKSWLPCLQNNRGWKSLAVLSCCPLMDTGKATANSSASSQTLDLILISPHSVEQLAQWYDISQCEGCLDSHWFKVASRLFFSNNRTWIQV